MMKFGIQMKLLLLCILLVILSISGMSVTYYMLTKQDKQRESRERIQIAFDIVLHDFDAQRDVFVNRVKEFLHDDLFLSTAGAYRQDPSRIRSISFVTSQLVKILDEFTRFGHGYSAQRLSLYAADKRLLTVYQQKEGQDSAGIYGSLKEGHDLYIPATDASQLTAILLGRETLPEQALPTGVESYYSGDFPGSLVAMPLQEGAHLGLRILAPLMSQDSVSGLLLVDMYYTQAMIERYASLSKTDINLFAGEQFSIGTLPDQPVPQTDLSRQLASCDDIRNQAAPISINSFSLGGDDYYQGLCSLAEASDFMGLMTVNLSQEVEKQEIRRIATAIVSIAIFISLLAAAFSIVFSRKAVQTIHDLASVIGVASEGDLRWDAPQATRDELGGLAESFNQMLKGLRVLTVQVQDASDTVKGTAGSIEGQMDMLVQSMGLQSSSMDMTTASVENITAFIEDVAQNTTELLVTDADILQQVEGTRERSEDVTQRTTALSHDLQRISNATEQVNASARSISSDTGKLAAGAEQADRELHQIERSFQEVSRNADETQRQARKTMNAAQEGQNTVEASILGMRDLKTMVTSTAQIIQEVNGWSERVSSILDIVDEITEQTSLLALNASIISAQAGKHGRGFAVVADEIKSLATRTKNSTHEISALIHELRMRAREGVRHTEEGMLKADQNVALAEAVQDVLTSILESATESSNHATDTAQIVQHTSASSRIMNNVMKNVTDMVAHIQSTIQTQVRDTEQVAGSVENISEMARSVNQTTLEQLEGSEKIAESMRQATSRFERIAEQTDELKRDAHQVVNAMHTIESTTEEILRNTHDLSANSVKNLVRQSELLQQIVQFFKVS